MKNKLDIGIKLISISDQDTFLIPKYMTEEASGMDIRAVINKELVLYPGCIEVISSGFALEIPVGFEAQVRPRSGLAARYGIGVLNSPGTIDSDYRGEVKVILVNFGLDPFKVSVGDRIAQIVFAKVYRANMKVINEFNKLTKRSFYGFGHTGI